MQKLQNLQAATVRTTIRLSSVLVPGLVVAGGGGLLQPDGVHLVLGAPGSGSHVQAMPGSVQVLVVAHHAHSLHVLQGADPSLQGVTSRGPQYHQCRALMPGVRNPWPDSLIGKVWLLSRRVRGCCRRWEG